MKYNFIDRADCYIRKTVRDVIQDLEIKVAHLMLLINFPQSMKVEGVRVLTKSFSKLREGIKSPVNAIAIYVEPKYHAQWEDLLDFMRSNSTSMVDKYL